MLDEHDASITFCFGFWLPQYTRSRVSLAVSSGLPGTAIMSIGQVDDLTLHGTRLKHQIETFTENQVSWFKIAVQYRGNFYSGEKEEDIKV